MSSPASALEVSAANAVDLVAAGSIEMGAHRPQDARAIAALLPAGTPVYVNQIEDERLDEVVTTGAYLDATQSILQKHGGLWFNDETFVVSRRQK